MARGHRRYSQQPGVVLQKRMDVSLAYTPSRSRRVSRTHLHRIGVSLPSNRAAATATRPDGPCTLANVFAESVARQRIKMLETVHAP